jgi:lipopolysaccharide/colanic/teichoic acid biosynthesis glycosyltransferase
VRSAYNACPFDALVLASPERASALGLADTTGVRQVVNFCEETGVSVYMQPGSFEIAVATQEVGALSGVPLIRLQDASSHPLYTVVKRLMDVSLALLVLTTGLPIWIATGLLVKLTSRGPVVFSQTRAGLHGRPFRIYKFRTMVCDAEHRLGALVDVDEPSVHGLEIDKHDDPRVTKVGWFLRRTCLDEIPQLINVLKGEMSLVGPRPELQKFVSRYTHEERRRLKARPGITGYQQIMERHRPLNKGLKYDLIYLKHQGLLLDLYILLMTPIVILRDRGLAQ